MNSNFHNIKLGNFRVVKDEGLKLGDLFGNRFKLVVRRVNNQIDNESIEKALYAFKENGFINYFGLQRFGTCIEAPTHLIGK